MKKIVFLNLLWIFLFMASLNNSFCQDANLCPGYYW